MAVSGSADVSKALQKLDLTKQAVIDEVYVLVDQISEIGIESARNKLNTSITRSGIERMKRRVGNSAGRNKTGNMIDSLKSMGIQVTDTTIRAKIGWETDSYFKFQERGTNRIPAANSLNTARRSMNNELPRLIKNMRERLRRKGLL